MKGGRWSTAGLGGGGLRAADVRIDEVEEYTIGKGFMETADVKMAYRFK